MSVKFNRTPDKKQKKNARIELNAFYARTTKVA